MYRMMQWGLLLFVIGLAASVKADCTGCKTTSDIQNKENDLDFKGACSLYKEAYDCNNNCADEQRELTKYVVDVCVAKTDHLSGCGLKLDECLSDMKLAKQDAKGQNRTMTCSELEKFAKCSFQAKADCGNKNVTSFLDILKTATDEMELEIGCDGKCAAAVGVCLENITALTTQHPDAAHFGAFCTDLEKSKQCVDAVEGVGACKGEKNIKLAAQLVETVAGQFSDLCGNNGKPTECMNEFVDCHKTLDDIKTLGVTKTQQCKDLSNFITCAERLPCHNALLPMVRTTIVGAVSEETLAKCPIIGGCKERIEKCAEMGDGWDPKDLDSFCKKGSEIEACFNVVRSDKTCSYEEAEMHGLEEQLSATFGHQCGNASVCISHLDKCFGIMAGINQGSKNRKDVCEKFNKWATCTDGTYRTDACVRMRQTLRVVDKSMMDENKKDCADPKLCETEIEKCLIPITETVKKNQTADDKFCPILRNSYTCINGLRKGVVCVMVDRNLKKDEETLHAMRPDCKGVIDGDNDGCASIKASLFVTIIAIIAHIVWN